MFMKMVLVMGVNMLMHQHLMLVQVSVVFCQVQPDTQPHQCAGQTQLPSDGFSKKQH